MSRYLSIQRKNEEIGEKVFLTINGLGLSPYNPHLPARFRALPIVYSLILLAWFSFLIPLSAYSLFNSGFSFPAFVIFLQKLCECLVPILVIIPSLRDNGLTLTDAFKDLVYADQCLYTVGVEVKYDEMKQYLERSYIGATVYFLSILGAVVYIILNVYGEIVSWISVIFIVLVVLSHLSYNIYFSYYFNCVVASFKIRFQCLNEEIKGLTPLYREGKTIILVKPYNLSSIKKVKTIKFVHAIYREIILDHNKNLNYVITLQLLLCLALLTLCVYLLLCMFLDIANFQGSDKYIAMMFLINIFQCTMTVCVTTICCARTSSEANNMQSVVHDLMNETEDKDVLQELENFSLELIHGKVVFTACGFFTIDYSLFTKIAGAMVSNVIIFMQLGNFDYHKLILTSPKN